MKILQLGKFYPVLGGVEKVMFDLTVLNFSLSCTQKSQISENKPQKYCTYQYL